MVAEGCGFFSSFTKKMFFLSPKGRGCNGSHRRADIGPVLSSIPRNLSDVMTSQPTCELWPPRYEFFTYEKRNLLLRNGRRGGLNSNGTPPISDVDPRSRRIDRVARERNGAASVPLNWSVFPVRFGSAISLLIFFSSDEEFCVCAN